MSTLKFDPQAYSIIVEAKIKARVPTIAQLVVDTGASFVVIPWKLALTVGLEVDPGKIIQTTTATAVETVPIVNIPEISVLGKTVKNVEAIIKDLPPEAPVDGLLGLSFLKHLKLTLNFKKGELKLE